MKKVIILIFVLFAVVSASFLFFGIRPKEAEPLQERSREEDFVQPEPSEEPIFLKSFSDLRDDFIERGESFLEINLADQKVRLYDQGELVRESRTLALGDPDTWGGSAAGIYRIRAGYPLSYSVVSEVYMPYALHYYGKYYLHGEPYYPGGRPLVSDFSGGCIRLPDQEAEKFYQLTEIGMPVLVVDHEREGHSHSNSRLFEFPDISARAYLVADLDSGFVLAEKNSVDTYPIASITKLMTAVILAENVDLNRSIEVDRSMLTAYGSIQGLEAGRRFRVVELFYPLLVESSNNAGEILSRFLGRAETIRSMNEKTENLLMFNTHFADPHGLSEENVSTARDIFQLTRYIAFNRPPLLEISRSREVRTFGPIQFTIDELWNKNLFPHDPNFLGGKTGFINSSRYTGTMIFQFLDDRGEVRRLIFIYLGSEEARRDVQRMYAWVRGNFPLRPVYE